jgi:hypothetical protein
LGKAIHWGFIKKSPEEKERIKLNKETEEKFIKIDLIKNTKHNIQNADFKRNLDYIQLVGVIYESYIQSKLYGNSYGKYKADYIIQHRYGYSAINLINHWELICFETEKQIELTKN